MAKFIQFVMFSLNVIFWIIGGVMLGIGIWLAVDDSAFEAINLASSAGMNDAVWATAVYIMISVGALLFLVGFLGCVGAMRADNPGTANCPLTLYIIIVKLIIIAEIVSVILAAIFWSSINDEIRTGMTKDVQTKYVNETSQDGISVSWNRIQVAWKCCGGMNYSDYHNSNYSKIEPYNVPWTCCVMKDRTDGKKEEDVLNIGQCRTEGTSPYNQTATYQFLNAQGCYDGLKEFIDDNAALLIGITCGFMALEIIGIIFACVLRKK